MAPASASHFITLPTTNPLDKTVAGCYPLTPMFARFFLGFVFLAVLAAHPVLGAVQLESPTTQAGYVARLLINEVPFPGDPLYRNEEDTMRCMLEILWVLDNRIRHIPPGYSQQRVANVETRDIIDVITPPGQVEDFYRNSAGQFTAAKRVFSRVEYLVRIANEGAPGRFGRLLNHAQGLARSYFDGHPSGEDLFGPLRRVGPYAVTGRGYAWMTSDLPYQPGGNFVAIPTQSEGTPGGNRFYTLRQVTP